MNGKVFSAIGCSALLLFLLGCSRRDGGNSPKTGIPTPESPGDTVEERTGSTAKNTDRKVLPQTPDFGRFLQFYAPLLEKADREGSLDSLMREIEREGGDEARPFLRLWSLRRRGDAKYEEEAKTYLRTHTDASLATDLLQLYAKAKREADFREVAGEMAKGDPHELLHCAEIARNEEWDAMKTSFAKDALAAQGGTYAIKYRCVAFLEETGAFDSVAQALPELERLAEKRYQKEDLTLLRCSLAVRNGTAGETERRQLRELAENGMVPPTRRQAAEWLLKLETNTTNRP